MADSMTFPDTVEEFMEQYKVVDTEEVYSNGCEFVPIFRMKQWFEHQNDRMKFVQEAVNTLMNSSETNSVKDKCFRNAARFVQNAIDGEPQDFERIPVTEWAPVMEQLPEDGTWNIFTDGKNVSVERYKMDAIDHFFPQGRWFSFDKAIAWMPLPKPYQEEGEQDGQT